MGALERLSAFRGRGHAVRINDDQEFMFYPVRVSRLVSGNLREVESQGRLEAVRREFAP